MRMDVERRRKGRPKQRWIDSVNVQLRKKGLLWEESQKQAVWRQPHTGLRHLCRDPSSRLMDG